ncbi:MAG: ATP-dependent sacrificial sulfur transferase LarE [Clostridia bacterium]
MELIKKENRLKELLLEKKHVAVAFSGGVDSTYLLAVCKDIEGLEVIALTAISPLHAKEEGQFAFDFAKENEIKHELIEMPLLEYKKIRENSPDRCYHCKRTIFSALIESVDERFTLADGTNLDDYKDYRPGLKACDELEIFHPLAMAEMTKSDIYALSEMRKLPTSTKPPFACLASRIPYNTFLTKENLRQVELAEEIIKKEGFKQYRVRHHGELARIELLPQDINRLLDEKKREIIYKELKKTGFSYVTVDLKGYKTGNMNINLDKNKKK